MIKKKINAVSPIGKTGYGITSLNILKNLSKQDIEISFFPIGSNIELNSEDEKGLFQQFLQNAETFDRSAPCLKIWHQHDLAARIGSGDYYCFPFFETDKLKNKEIHNINSCDYIFTASNWGKKILLENNIKIPITVAPLGVDTSVFKSPEKIKINNGNYIFFHIGKWEKRKSQDFLLKAFELAFDENDKVELWLLPKNPFLSQEEENAWFSLVDNNKLKDKIKIIDRLPNQYAVAEFIYYGDCGVFLSRAEGWNNEILESMALDKPIIATNYSAHTEYLNANNSLMVEIDELEEAIDNKWFFGDGKWAKLGDNEMAQTIDHMRMVYKNDIRTNPAGLETAQKYSWENTASVISQTLIRNNSYNVKRRRKKTR
jgi:glycosyltransferase involved in cell wall biosynthesis